MGLSCNDFFCVRLPQHGGSHYHLKTLLIILFRRSYFVGKTSRDFRNRWKIHFRDRSNHTTRSFFSFIPSFDHPYIRIEKKYDYQ